MRRMQISPQDYPAGVRHSREGSLWAITTYFNPVHYRTRRENYTVFRERLPVPLIAVEYSVDEFELREQDAEILVQLRGRDVLWQKERLYNLARRHLPPDCEEVLWIDCDIVLGGSDWPAAVKAAVRQHTFVQPFQRVALLGPGVTPPPRDAADIADWRTSLVAYLENGATPSEVFSRWGTSLQKKYFHGGAWAARRSVFDSFEYYDRMIVGGGDKAFTAAVYGRFEDVAASSSFEESARHDYVTWAAALHGLVTDAPGYLAHTACHLWHGSLVNRGYDDRLAKLRAAGFSALEDLALDPATGCWQWATDKPELHDYVRGHFIRRREDG